MKIRNGFVSNSSSSSFICSVCGESETYYDGLEEAGAIQCEGQWHIFHEDCVKKFDLEFTEDRNYGKCVTRASCPICNLSVLPDSDELTFLREKYKMSKDEILTELRKTKG
jgi:hypothetical protein